MGYLSGIYKYEFMKPMLASQNCHHTYTYIYNTFIYTVGNFLMTYGVKIVNINRIQVTQNEVKVIFGM